ncbi:hypothetical protein PoB_007308900 [Plakobranchus ocellatus]|uniref:Uncharacterized protein n=1 Tax=Plakobranchus ocellatus TaxID=259542 RepID=A0AAV4DQU7_9GAST|nr:hypothetical protein PoB_007308900 [Plakobranchus ocellatus]
MNVLLAQKSQFLEVFSQSKNPSFHHHHHHHHFDHLLNRCYHLHHYHYYRLLHFCHHHHHHYHYYRLLHFCHHHHHHYCDDDCSDIDGDSGGVGSLTSIQDLIQRNIIACPHHQGHITSSLWLTITRRRVKFYFPVS